MQYDKFDNFIGGEILPPNGLLVFPYSYAAVTYANAFRWTNFISPSI